MKRLFQIIILFAFVIVACQTPDSNQYSSNNITSSTLTPTETFTQTQTTTDVIPSNTPVTLDLPHWVKYSFPGGNLALPYKESANVYPSKVVFINPENGNKFFVELSNEFYYYYWRTNENIVFFHEGDCDTSPKYVSDMNVSSGYLQMYVTETYPEKIPNCYSNLYDEKIRLNKSFSERTIEYTDPSSGETFQLTDPSDGITDIAFQLSRYKIFLAVVQFDGKFEFNESNETVYGNKISIVDLRNHKLILEYFEEQGILSEVSFISDGVLAYMRGNTPCLILIYSQEKKCVHNISNKFPDSKIILSQHTYHDGERLRFLYVSQQNGGYCSYNIISGESGCITDRFSSFDNQYIINYSLSHFGHYVLLEYSNKECIVTWCNYPETTYLALINQEGELFELGSSDIYYLSNSFRPLRPNPWQPWDWYW